MRRDLKERYGAAIRFYREGTQCTQAQLARRMRVDESFVCHLESGRRAPSIETLHALASAMNVRARDIVAHVEAG